MISIAQMPGNVKEKHRCKTELRFATFFDKLPEKGK
jgi:hypothetical protein